MLPMTITPRFSDNFDYRWTFFNDLEVSAHSITEKYNKNEKTDSVETIDPFAALINSAKEQKTDTKMVEMSPEKIPEIHAHVSKWHFPHDKRYNPIVQNWTLDQLILRLDQALSFGPVGPKIAEKFSGFSIECTRPEDEVVSVKDSGVYLSEWPFEPIYCQDQFEMLSSAITSLKEIRKFLNSQGL